MPATTTSVYLTPALAEALRRLRVEQGITMKFALHEALKAYLQTKGITI